jgi:hypothetical protein
VKSACPDASTTAIAWYDTIGKTCLTLQQLQFHPATAISPKHNLQDPDRPMKKKLL